MIYAILIGILPAIFIVWGGSYIQGSKSIEEESNWLMFHLGVLVLLLSTLVIATVSDRRSASFVYVMLLSATCGTMVSFYL